jgi:hypothetical protein
MDAAEIIRLLNTNHYSPANLEEVNDLCRNYPMFSLAHMLRARIKTALGQPADDSLKLAAIYAGDRGRLMSLVMEFAPASVAEPAEETTPEDSTGIHFSDEPSQEAEVIIFQHAPYAATAVEENLLELDEELGEEPFKLEEEEELSSEKIVGLVVKDDVDMEEPEVTEIPNIDVEEPEVAGIPDIEAEEPEVAGEKKERVAEHMELIERFIKGEPGPIRADRETTLKGDVSRDSIREHDGLITDTLCESHLCLRKIKFEISGKKCLLCSAN